MKGGMHKRTVAGRADVKVESGEDDWIGWNRHAHGKYRR